MPRPTTWHRPGDSLASSSNLTGATESCIDSGRTGLKKRMQVLRRLQATPIQTPFDCNPERKRVPDFFARPLLLLSVSGRVEVSGDPRLPSQRVHATSSALDFMHHQCAACCVGCTVHCCLPMGKYRWELRKPFPCGILSRITTIFVQSIPNLHPGVIVSRSSQELVLPTV